jgi:hypothetical protein
MENLFHSMICFVLLLSSVLGFIRGEIAWGIACLLVLSIYFSALVKGIIISAFKERLKNNKNCRKEKDDEQRD